MFAYVLCNSNISVFFRELENDLVYTRKFVGTCLLSIYLARSIALTQTKSIQIREGRIKRGRRFERGWKLWQVLKLFCASVFGVVFNRGRIICVD